jgi:hypothetical protein
MARLTVVLPTALGHFLGFSFLGSFCLFSYFRALSLWGAEEKDHRCWPGFYLALKSLQLRGLEQAYGGSPRFFVFCFLFFFLEALERLC